MIGFGYFGNPWLGLFIRTNDEITIVPVDTPPKLCAVIEEQLKTVIVKVSIGYSNLLGRYTVMNSNGIVVPNITNDEEIGILKKAGLNIHKSSEKMNAHGNNVVVNDEGGVINRRVRKSERAAIEDTLGVELLEGSIANYSTVGSACIATNKGFLIHYNASNDDVKLAENALHVRGERGTVNMGTGFVALGFVCNKNGCLAGALSSAFEVGRARSALGFI